MHFVYYRSVRMRVGTRIELSEDERLELSQLTASRLTSVRLSQRARIVLLAADGLQDKEIAEQLGIGRIQAARWRGRYAQSRLAGIERDLPPAALAIHTDLNAVLLEQADEGRAGELAALVGVHDFRPAVLHDGFFQGIHTGIGRQAVR